LAIFILLSDRFIYGPTPYFSSRSINFIILPAKVAAPAKVQIIVIIVIV